MRLHLCTLSAALVTVLLLCACSIPNDVFPVSEDTPSAIHGAAVRYHVCDKSGRMTHVIKLELVQCLLSICVFQVPAERITRAAC
jgi:hypothetical protein